jgi:hypothetical protein
MAIKYCHKRDPCVFFNELRMKRAFDQLRLRRSIEKEFVYGTYVEILAVFCLFRKNRPEIVFVYMNGMDVENDMN